MIIEITINGSLYDPPNYENPAEKCLFTCSDCHKSFYAPMFVWMMRFTLEGRDELMKDPMCGSCAAATFVKTQALVHTAFISNNTK